MWKRKPPIISNLKYKIWAHRSSIKGTKPLFIVIKAIISFDTSFGGGQQPKKSPKKNAHVLSDVLLTFSKIRGQNFAAKKNRIPLSFNELINAWMDSVFNTGPDNLRSRFLHWGQSQTHTTSKQHLCVQGPLWECLRTGGFWATLSSNYCALLVCVSRVQGGLAVWCFTRKQTHKQTNLPNGYGSIRHARCPHLRSPLQSYWQAIHQQKDSGVSQHFWVPDACLPLQFWNHAGWQAKWSSLRQPHFVERPQQTLTCQTNQPANTPQQSFWPDLVSKPFQTPTYSCVRVTGCTCENLECVCVSIMV